MKSEWKVKKIGDIVDIRRGASPRPIHKFLSSEGMPWVKIADATSDNSRYIQKTNEYIINEGVKKSVMVTPETLIVSNSATPGLPKIMKINACVHDGWLIFSNYKGITRDFLYYKFIDIRRKLVNQANGSVFQNLKTDIVREFDINIPSINTQNKIVLILSNIDDKIELNERINKNLLHQAMTIFNNAIEHSTSITLTELGELADIKGGKRLPKGINLTNTPNSHPYIRVRDLNNVVFASLSTNYEYVDDETQKTISRYITTTNDVLLSIVGTIGLTAIVDESLNMANLTENCVKITNLNNISPEYLLLYLRSSRGTEEIKKNTVGAVQSKLPIKNIQRITIPLLPQSEIKSLNSILTALFNQISSNDAESRCLSDIRDSLLPKLMSGELDVSDINI